MSTSTLDVGPAPSAVPEVIITLEDVTPSATPPAARDNHDFLAQAIGQPTRIHHLSCDSTLIPSPTAELDAYPVGVASQLIQSVHTAFAEHHPLTIGPELLWYALVHDVAICVKKHPGEFAKHFTRRPGEKKTLQVRDDTLVYGEENDWGRTLLGFRGLLRDEIAPEVMELFLPPISTMTPVEEVAILVAFMDTVSSYYTFEVHSLCGIPKIRLRGSPDDWDALRTRLGTFTTMFPRLAAYFADAAGVLEEIARAAAGLVDEEFWSSIYKWNRQSGGPFVSGWITAFSAYVPGPLGFQLRKDFDWRAAGRGTFGGLTTNEFPAHVSRVPLVWEYLGERIDMALVGGVLGAEWDGFVTPRLGFGVVEGAAH